MKKSMFILLLCLSLQVPAVNAQIKISETQRTPVAVSSDKENHSQNKVYLSRQQIVREAEHYLGVPYVWGGTSPDGFDCSGLVQYVYATYGILLPRTTQEQCLVGQRIAIEDANVGDLYFWEDEVDIYHVAIASGEGGFIHAPRPGLCICHDSVSIFRPSFAVRILETEG